MLLSLEEQAAAKYGLDIHSKDEWNDLAPQQQSSSSSSSSFSRHNIPPLSSLLESNHKDDDDKNSRALVVAQETRALRKQQTKSGGGNLGQLAYQTIKGLAPIVGPLIRSASYGGKNVGLSVAGSLLEQLPTLVDAHNGVLDVTGIDTLIYLDDSGSMQGSNLEEGRKALRSLESSLKTRTTDDSDERFLPTRIVKFGNYPTIINPSEEDWSVSLVTTAWDGSSGGTYMWKMIQDDIQSKYRPAGGKLRIVVITDGYDNWSPPPYNGVRGFDPLMRTLLKDGYDIEWNIIVVGNHSGIFQQQPELSPRDQELYKSLCHATGGQFLSVGADGWDETDPNVDGFLDAIEDSGYHDSEDSRRERQEQYRLEARKGKAVNFDWLPALPDKDDDKDK